MSLVIVSGQEGTDIEDLFRRVISENGYEYESASKMVFPEYSQFLRHPRTLYNHIRAMVKEHIEQDKDLFILTFSDYVMYGVRAEVKKNCFDEAVVHILKSDGEDVISSIDSNTSKYDFVKGTFDVMSDALDEILGW